MYPVVSIYGAVTALYMLQQVWLAYAVTDQPAQVSDELRALAGVVPAQRPDVYHVIVDGFGRPDVLRDRYELDLSDFVRSLTARGFEVAEIAGDQGVGGKVEGRRRLPSAPTSLGVASIYGFYDIGAAWKHDVPGRESAATAGVGA